MGIFKNPAQEHEYRSRTNNDTAIAGITRPSFQCQRCKEYRLTKGRRRIAHRWLCRQCVDARVSPNQGD